jgi:UDP-N-acetylmuramoylalanine--D-glutamate ligase
VTVEKFKVIVGLGKTGYSCAKFFMRRGIPFSIADDNLNPGYLDRLREDIPNIEVRPINDDTFSNVDQIVLSPGVPLSNRAIQLAIEAGSSVTGDIAIFAAETKLPYAAITGTNGKSTVTQLLSEMALASGRRVGVGGNIGTPCLELLEDNVDLNILEVSSYQLEVVESLGANVAVLLNLTPDHLDRYQSNEDYYQTKLKIFDGCSVAVVPRDLNLNFDPTLEVISFGLDEPKTDKEFGIKVLGDSTYLAIGSRPLLPVRELTMKGRHNWLNALAGLAAGHALSLSEENMFDVLRSFTGLPHRCQWVGEYHQIQFINDSKATNPSSTIAAIEGLSSEGNAMVLILGGVSKGADLSELQSAITKNVSTCLIFGQDRELIKSMLKGGLTKIALFENLEMLVSYLKNTAHQGDLVLFSPACASFDQFDNFEHRGEVFTQLIKGCFT